MKKEKIIDKNVYNGYEEKYLNGLELKKLFVDEFYCAGRHHESVYDLTIPQYLNSINIQDEKEYRIFLNDRFCKIMNAKTNGSLDFFAHSKIDLHYQYTHSNETPMCPICNSIMQVKIGKYGPFWSCSDYPKCKGSKKIFIIGNFNGFTPCNIPKTIQ